MAKRSIFKRAEKAVRERVRRMRLRMSNGGSQILRVHDGVEGQLHFKESVWLYRIAEEAAKLARIRGEGATIVEIGSFRGRSTALLALGGGANAIVHAIDPHLDFEQDSDDRPEKITHYGEDDRRAFEANMKRFGVASRIRKVQMLSNDARPMYDGGPIDVLWVDGDHHYEAVRDDLANWGPLVRRNGVVACHDYTHWADVRKAWAEVITAQPGTWGVVGDCQSIVWATKTS